MLTRILCRLGLHRRLTLITIPHPVRGFGDSWIAVWTCDDCGRRVS